MQPVACHCLSFVVVELRLDKLCYIISLLCCCCSHRRSSLSQQKCRRPYFYGLLKIHKNNVPMRPVVSIFDTISRNCASFLAKLLSPVVGLKATHLSDRNQLLSELNNLNINWSKVVIASFDVSSLYTNISLEDSLVILENRLKD